MGLGQGGNDLGTSPEVLFDEAAKVGNLVVETARRRSELKIKNGEGKEDTPNIPFLEIDKLNPRYVDLLKKEGKIDKDSITEAEAASLGLSLEASLQIVNAKSVKPPGVFIEDLDSLQDMERTLSVIKEYVKAESDKSASLVGNVAMTIIEDNKLEVPSDLSAWANGIAGKAHERMTKKVEGVRSVLGVKLP
jgi:hypothetical protein